MVGQITYGDGIFQEGFKVGEVIGEWGGEVDKVEVFATEQGGDGGDGFGATGDIDNGIGLEWKRVGIFGKSEGLAIEGLVLVAGEDGASVDDGVGDIIFDELFQIHDVVLMFGGWTGVENGFGE